MVIPSQNLSKIQDIIIGFIFQAFDSMAAFMINTILVILEHNSVHTQSMEHRLSANTQEVQGLHLLLKGFLHTE